MNTKIIIETLVTVFSTFDGDIKVLLVKRKNDPYKGYWELPNNILKENESLEDNITDAVIEKLGIPNIYLEQLNTFSEPNRYAESEQVISCNFLGLVDSLTIQLKRALNEEYETAWFNINSIPKMAYDHENIINKTIYALKMRGENHNFFKHLFQDEFTLPEMQNAYEQLLNVNYDRRNFRKKMLHDEVIEKAGYKSEGNMGRPADLYRFKNNEELAMQQ
jgi:8-oxo-dGTP diphosphatase